MAAIGILSFYPAAVAAPIEPSTVYAASALTTKAEITDYIEFDAKQYGVSPDLALWVATHEDPALDPTVIGDMDIVCESGPNKGKPYRSKGIFQESDCGHPEISDACAFDAKCNIDAAMPMLAERTTCLSQFSTCRSWPGLSQK